MDDVLNNQEEFYIFMKITNNLGIAHRNKYGLKIFKILFFVILIIYIMLAVFVHFFLERVILWPRDQFVEVSELDIQEGRIENIELTMKDDIILRGWLVKNSTSEKANLLIYFGGNAEELSSVISKMYKLGNWNVALINY